MRKIIFITLSFILFASCASLPPKHLTSSEKEFLSYARYIISNDEEQAFLNLQSASEREKFIQEFWLKRDPTPDTALNEFKEIYFKRIEMANRLFRGGRPGWMTDRGMIFILLGPPDDREDYPMGVTSEEKPTEVWIYNSLPGKPELRLEFVDFLGTRDYRLVSDFSRETANAFIPEGMNISYRDQTGGPVIASATTLSSRKSPQELKLDKMQETGKAITRSQKKPEVKKGEVVDSYEEIKIPSQVRQIFDQDILTRSPRTDISINYLRTLYLPAQQNNVYAIFLFKIKNADLYFQEETDLATEKLFTELDVFLRFYKMEKGKVGEVFKEIYIPYPVELDKEEYRPETENLYAIGDPLPPGEYFLAMAFASTDLSRIGTYYFEFFLPGPSSFREELDITPVFFLKSLQRISSPETEVNVHKNHFFYSVLKIEPKEENIFSQGETPDIFYFIYGARPNWEKRFDIEIDYKVKKDGEEVIKYATQTYSAPFISHPLPFDIGERHLDAGKYILEIRIRDNISSLSMKKEIPFEIR